MRRFLFLLVISIFLLLGFLYIPESVAAASCVQYNLDTECTKDPGGAKIKDYRPGMECEDIRYIYTCPGDLLCSREETTCDSNQSVCNNPGVNDGYTCTNFCTDLRNGSTNGTPNCGVPPGVNCNDFYNTCVNTYCRPADYPSSKYTCSSPAECNSLHQCVTQAPTVDIDVNVSNITVGKSFTLSWTSARAEECRTARASEDSDSDWTPQGDPRAAEGDENRSESSLGTYKYTLVCANTAGSTQDAVYVTIEAPTPSPTTPTPTQPPLGQWVPPSCSGSTFSGCKIQGNENCTNWGTGSNWTNCSQYCSGFGQVKSDACAPNTCKLTVTQKGPPTASVSISPLVSPRTHVVWKVNESDIGTNTGEPASFTTRGGRDYTVKADQYGGGASNISCQTSFSTSGPGSGGGGGPSTTPASPTPTSEPLQGTGAIRFYNADCTTPYNGEDTFKVLSVAINADGKYENDIWASGGGHNTLFYNGKASTDPGYSHNANEGVRGCESTAWHPYYDPGHQLNADGTISACGGGSGTGFKWQCEEDGDYRDPDSCDDYNNDGTSAGTTECCSRGGTLRNVLDGGTGSCIDQNSNPNSSSPPQCYPNNYQPWTINGTNNNRINLTSTRGMRRLFSVAGSTSSKIKVLKVCTLDNCDWWGAENPSSSPNRGWTEKNFNQGANKNYFFSDWAYSTSNEGSYVYDICVQGAGVTISGNVFVDRDGDGQKDSGEGNYGGARVFINQTLYTADANGNYIAESLQTRQNYTVDLDSPSTHRVTTGNDPTTFNNLNSDRTVNFGITPTAQAWFQTKDADIFAFGNLRSSIPTQCMTPQCTPFLSLVGDGGYPGIPVYGSGTPDFGWGTVSETGWLANSRHSGTIYNYAYFARRLPSNYQALSRTVNGGTIVSQTANSGYTYFYSDGPLTIESTTNLGNKKAVIFVNGTLTIKGRITINKGNGFFAAIVSGDILIDPEVSHPNQPALEGIFLSDGSIRTGTRGSSDDDSLYVRGMLVSPGLVVLDRNLDPSGSGIKNEQKPAEFIEYAPDLILNLPPQLLRNNPVWEEVAP